MSLGYCHSDLILLEYCLQLYDNARNNTEHVLRLPYYLLHKDYRSPDPQLCYPTGSLSCSSHSFL